MDYEPTRNHLRKTSKIKVVWDNFIAILKLITLIRKSRNMSYTSYILRERYFVIKSNGVINEYNSFQDANKDVERGILVVDSFKEFFTPQNGDPWRISEFEFYNANKVVTKLKCNNWVAERIDITYKSSSTLNFNVNFSDPLKKIKISPFKILGGRKSSDYTSHDMGIVVKIQDELKRLSVYQNWEQIDLLNENEKLKIQIAELQKRLKSGSAG